MRSHLPKLFAPGALLFVVGLMLTVGASAAQASAGMVRSSGALSAGHSGTSVVFVISSLAISVLVLVLAVYPAVANRQELAPASAGELEQIHGAGGKTEPEQERKAA